MKTYIYEFEGAYGIIHKLIVGAECSSFFPDKLADLVKDAFLEAKSILEDTICKIPSIESIEIFPEQNLIEKVLFYNSNGIHKNLITNYFVLNHLDGSVEVTIKLNTADFWKMTSKEVEEITYKHLRQPLWWEEYGKKFHRALHNAEVIRTYINQKKILKCYYYDKPYYFNIGIDEPEVTDYMIEEAIWFVYE